MKVKKLTEEGVNVFVTTLTKGEKEFIGYSVLHPDDMKYKSSFFGIELSNMRADLYKLENELKEKKNDYRNCEIFLKASSQYKYFDKKSPTAKAMYRQLNRKKKAILLLEREIALRKSDIQIYINVRERLNRKIDERSKENND